MRKLTLCCIVLALAVAMAPSSQAAVRCIHFTNFCDSIQVNNTVTETTFPGSKANYGGWDWECLGDWTSASIIGNSATKSLMATRVVYSGTIYAYAYTSGFGFVFKKTGSFFNLEDTNGSSMFALQTNQPWTLTSGACRSADVDLSKPRSSWTK